MSSPNQNNKQLTASVSTGDSLIRLIIFIFYWEALLEKKSMQIKKKFCEQKQFNITTHIINI